jgi:hypothetical protein
MMKMRTPVRLTSGYAVLRVSLRGKEKKYSGPPIDARVDLRADASGELHVLEVNANPCLAPDAGFAAALAHAEIDYARAVGALVAAAVERGASTEGRLAP